MSAALAQTNVQLFNRLEDRAYSETEIVAVRDAYVLAMHLFSGLYRSSGKTFVAHAVGTASVLVDLRAPVHVVVGGLLHAAYTHGDFGTFRRKMSVRKRARVRAAIGAPAEELVSQYAALPWNGHAVQALLNERITLPARRDVLLIRLANEIDEYGDLAALYTPGWERRVAAARTFVPLCADLAERLGAPELREALRRVAMETLRRNRPLVVTVASSESLLVPPASHGPRLHVRLRTLARGLRRKLRL